MLQKLLNIRYIVILVVAFCFLNSGFFIIGGSVLSIKGYVAHVQNGFMPMEDYQSGLYIMKGLDAFMLAIIFIIFGLGLARLFLVKEDSKEQIPTWLRFDDMKGLKVLLWETILVTLVIFCLQTLLTAHTQKAELLILPGAILLLSVALFFVRWKEKPLKPKD